MLYFAAVFTQLESRKIPVMLFISLHQNSEFEQATLSLNSFRIGERTNRQINAQIKLGD